MWRVKHRGAKVEMGRLVEGMRGCWLGPGRGASCHC